MRIEQALISYLTNNTALVALVAKRIYAFHSPADTVFPFVTYQRVSSEKFLTLDQPINDLAIARIQFDIFSDRYSDGLAVLDALRDALQGYQGAMSTMKVQAVLPALEQHIDLPEMDYYRITVDYRIFHREE